MGKIVSISSSHEYETAHEVLMELLRATTPIPGRPGWRVDGKGKEWYSADWIHRHND